MQHIIHFTLGFINIPKIQNKNMNREPGYINTPEWVLKNLNKIIGEDEYNEKF